MKVLWEGSKPDSVSNPSISLRTIVRNLSQLRQNRICHDFTWCLSLMRVPLSGTPVKMVSANRRTHRSKVAAGGITLNLHRMVRVVSLINHNLTILG